jgi:hypothetical protein
LIKAEVVGELRRIAANPNGFKIGVKVRFSVDMQKYKTWRNAAEPVLAKLATHVTELRWEPTEKNGLEPIPEVQRKRPMFKQFPANQLAIPAEERAGRFGEDFWGYVSMTPSEIEESLGFPVRYGHTHWIPTSFLDVPAVIVLDRGPKGTVHIYSLQKDVFAAVSTAHIEIPVIRLTFRDEGGKEIARTQRSAIFYGEVKQGDNSDKKAFVATPLWWTGLATDGSQELTPLLSAKEMAEHGRWEHCLQSKLFVSPFVARLGFSNTEYQGLLPAFAYEFRLELQNDELTRVKRIEAEILPNTDMDSVEIGR